MVFKCKNFLKREKYSCRSVTFSNVADGRYQIAQNVSYDYDLKLDPRILITLNRLSPKILSQQFLLEKLVRHVVIAR